MAVSPNKDELYRMGVQAAKQGQKQSARMMFQQVLQQDSRHIKAMMWMAKLTSNIDEREKWVQRVLKLNPKHEAAQKALRKIETRDVARRNRILMQVGVVAYVIVVILASVIAMIAFT